MDRANKSKQLGIVWLCVGVAFLGVSASGQAAFLGVGMAFIGLGVVFLARSKQGG